MNNYPQKKSKLQMILTIAGICFIVILISVAAIVYFSYNTNTPSDILEDETVMRDNFKGTVLTYSPIQDDTDNKVDIQPYAEAIRTTLTSQGYTECMVVENKNKIIVQMPGVFDYAYAEELALKPVLEFKDVNGNVILSADSIEVARAEYTNMSAGSKGNIVFIAFTDEGTKLFEEATRKISEMPPSQNIIGIYLNGDLISAPAVPVPIDGGECYIEGDFTEHEAKRLASQIKAASLNYEIKLESREVISK